MIAMRVVAHGQTYVPSRYRILLNPSDLEALEASDGDLSALLADAILVRAREQGQWLLRRPDVALVGVARVSQGDLEVDAEPLDPTLVAAAATGLRPVELEGPRPPRAPIPGTGVVDDEVVAASGAFVRSGSETLSPPPGGAARAAIPVVAEAGTPPPLIPVAQPSAPSPSMPTPSSDGVQPDGATPASVAPTPAALAPRVELAPLAPSVAPAPVAPPIAPVLEPDGPVPQPLLPPPLVGPHATIEVCLPDGARLDVAFDGTVLDVGRGTDNHIVIPDERVSRHHGRFSARHGTLVYTDLGSTNGSQVGGVPVREVALGAGDVVRLGRATLTVRPRP